MFATTHDGHDSYCHNVAWDAVCMHKGYAMSGAPLFTYSCVYGSMLEAVGNNDQ